MVLIGLPVVVRTQAVLAVLAVTFVTWLAIPASASAALSPQSVIVETKGTVPGFNDVALRAYIAEKMNSGVGRWHFATGNNDAADRVVWTFKLGPQASGTVRSFGFSRAMLARLTGLPRVLTIEARLYLNGEYQTLAFGDTTSGNHGQSADFADEITKVSQLLMQAAADLDIPQPTSRPPT